MSNDERARGGRRQGAEEAHTVRDNPSRLDTCGTSLSTHDLHSASANPTGDDDDDDDDDDDRDAALMRAVAYAPPRRPPSTVIPGTRWSESGRYLIDRRLGRGGMGTVYAATDTALNRIVALKVLDVAGADHDPAHHAGLLREAQLAASMEHERIARVYDVGSHEGFAFVAMEYVAGGTLRQWIARGDLALTQIVDIVTQIAEGLAELHAKGVVHRDLKPENVMMTAQGGVKLVDFGLARHGVLQAGEASEPPHARHSTSTAASSGTPGYMAPEQCNGQSMDERVDIFALGVILYELISHEKPFRGATVGAIVNATIEATPIFDDAVWALVPPRLRQHTARMLEGDPDARFEHGSSVLAALRELAAELPTERSTPPLAAAQATASAPAQRAGRRRPPVFVDVGVATRGLELPVAITAFACLALQAAQPQLSPHAPVGMALIDVGAIAVGHHAWDLERECHDIGSHCIPWYLYNEAPRTQVTVKPFFLDREEVTNAQFVTLLDEHSGLLTVFDDDELHYPRFVRENAGEGEHLIFDLYAKHSGIEYVDHHVFRVRRGQQQQPAVQMTWYAAGLYCARKGKRLPTENEWEAAARGREDRRFPWGDGLPRCGQVTIADDGWIPGKPDCLVPAVSVPVGTMTQDVTPEGVHDLGGNVSEWTASWFVEGNRAAQPTTAPRDAMRVIRGGSWSGSLMARTSGRDGLSPSVVGPNIGFRCASDLEDAAP